MPNGRAVSISLSALLAASLALSACSGGAEKSAAPATAAATAAPATPSVPAPTQPRVSPAATASGAHASYAASGFTCVTCHPCGVKDPNGHGITWMDTTSTAFHAYSANQNLAGCQACHGPALDGVGGSTAVSCASCHGATWKTGCTTCHGGTDSQTGAPPRTTWGNSADTVRVGTHTAHLAATHALSRPVACSACHVVPADALAAGHANGTTADVTFSGLAVQGATPTWNRTSATCSNTYCHGSTLAAGGAVTTPVWTTTNGSARACTACHGAPPPSPHPANSDCGACHPGYTATTVAAATHIDGKLDVTGMTCTSCHGDATRTATTLNPQLAAAPPAGSKGETATTTRAVGAHQRHLVAGALSNGVACTECHVPPTSTSHSNGVVDLAWGTLARTGNVSVTWNGSTCSGSYCHGNFKNGNLTYAPSWTLPATTACGTCHGLPPGGTHPTNAASCGSCHGGYTATTVNLATHMNGTVDVVAMTCTSCHGDATRAATTLNPQLAAAPPVGTKGETALTTRAVGAHQRHLTAGAAGNAMACTECHAVPTSASHSNGVVDLAWGTLARTGNVTVTWNGTTCSGTYCHGNFKNGNLTYAPNWTTPATNACGTCHGLPPGGTHPANSACGSCHTGYSASTVNAATHMNGVVDVVAMTCTSCHGDATRAATALNPQLAAAPPVGTKGETATTTRAVGAHQAHLLNTTLRSAALACTECHAVPTSTSHATGTVDMTWGTLARTGNFVPTWTGTTCTNYCHGSSLGAGGTVTAPSWTLGATQDACGTCHGVPPPAPHSTSTACGTCHAGYTSTSVNLATHINGVVDVTSNHPAGWADKTQHGYQANLTGLAGCKSCHGTDLAGGTSGVSCAACHTTNGFAGWDTNCTFCHGNRTTGRQSPPVDIQGRTVTTNTSVGRHDSHVGSTMMATIGCAACHPARSTSVITDTAHVDGNGIAEVALQSFGYTSGGTTTTVTGTYTRTSATAATCTVYCHSNFSTTSGGPRTSTSKSWVATTAASCTSCHSTKSSRHTSPSAHSSTACSTCHGAGYTSSSVTGAAVATHIDGKKNIVTTATGTGVRTWNATTRTCTASCHGSKTW